MKKLLLPLMLGLFLSGTAFAKSYICTTKANNTVYIKDDTVLVCTGGLGNNMTMAKINSQGFRVVSITVGFDNGRDWAIVIEK